MRNSQGEKIDPGVAIPWQTESQRIINIIGLAASIQQRLGQSNHLFTATQFALETIEGVEKIRFVIH